MSMRSHWIAGFALCLALFACTGGAETSPTKEPGIPDASTTETTTTVDVPAAGGASQSPADAARNGIVPALAELSLADRVSIVVSESTSEGVWAISEVPDSTDAPGCIIGDRGGRYGTDFICVDEYREVLLLTENLTQIIRAYPLPSQPARLLLVTSDAVYCARQGDGGLPDSMLCRIDRERLDISGTIFPYSTESVYGRPEGNAVPYGDWTIAPVSSAVIMETLDFTGGQIVTTGHDGIAYYDPVTLVRLSVERSPSSRRDLVEPTHRVVNVTSRDTLNVRRAPGADEQLYAKLAPTYSGVRATGRTNVVEDGGEWWEVELLDPVRLFDLQEPLHGGLIVGWVNSAFLEPYDPAFSSVPACTGSGPVEALTPIANREKADHIFQIREYELADGCLRIVITFGTDFDDSGIAPRYDMISTDMRPVGNVPGFEIERAQHTTVIKLEGIDHVWATQSSNVISEIRNDEAVDAFSVRRADGSVDVYIPVTGWPQGVTTNPATGELIVDIIKMGPDTRLRTESGIHVIGEPVFTAGGTFEFMGLARPFEATVGIQIRQDDKLVVDGYAMTTDWLETWGLFRYRAVGLDPEQDATVTISQDSEPEPAGLTFEFQSELDTSQPTSAQLIDPSDLKMTDTLLDFAKGEVPFEDVSFSDEVVLGLNTVEQIRVDGSDLASASTWIIPREEFAGLVGPFDVIGPLRTERGISQVNVGPRPHCAGPPLDFGPGWDQGRHLVIEPTGISSCLQWYAVHLLVNDTNQIQAVTLDPWEP